MKIKKLVKHYVKQLFKEKENIEIKENINILNKLNDTDGKQIDKNIKEKEFNDALKLVNM